MSATSITSGAAAAVVHQPKADARSKPSSSTRSFEFRPVRGYDDRMKVAVDLFKKHMGVTSGSNSNDAFGALLEKERHHARLLFDGDVPKGLLVYQEPASRFDSLHVMTFCSVDAAGSEQQAIFRQLLNKAKEKARETRASELTVALRATHRAAVDFLKAEKLDEFQSAADTSDLKFTLSLVDFTRKRPRVDDDNSAGGESIPAYKKARVEIGMEGTQAVVRVAQEAKPAAASAGGSESTGRSRDGVATSATPRWRFSRDGSASARADGGSFRTPQGSKEKPRECTLRNKYIHYIQQRQKTIEARIKSGMFLAYRVGDYVRFFYQQNPRDDALCKITAVTHYPSFRAMLEKEGYANCVPEARSLEQATKIYLDIPGYAEKSGKSGVVAFKIELQRSSENGR